MTARASSVCEAGLGSRLLAAGIALFAAGVLVDRFLPDWREAAGIEVASDSEDEWRQAVAQYMSLYTPETIVGISDDPSHMERELAIVGAKLGIHLPPSQVSLPGVALKRAQILQYDGKPLGQVAYLDPRDGVMALCIYADSHAGYRADHRAASGLEHRALGSAMAAPSCWSGARPCLSCATSLASCPGG